MKGVLILVSLIAASKAEIIAGCSDQNPNCPLLASLGECTKDPSYMLEKCKLSCNACQGCSDQNPLCPLLASLGECTKDPSYMLEKCKLSCNACQDVDDISACGVTAYSSLRMIANSSLRIVGGETAKPHEIPWQVGLVWFGPWQKIPFCGGTIICPNFVLSAAHCTALGDHNADLFEILAGEHDWMQENDEATLHSVASITPHPRYIGRPTRYEYDLVIMKLKDPIVLDGWSKVPACLPNPYDDNFDQRTKFVTSGWGTIEKLGSKNKPNQLKRASVKFCPAFDPICEACSRSDIKLCVKSNEGVGACSGDSGGPLTWVDPRTSKVKLVGVASYVGDIDGKGSCASNNPRQTATVYAKVSLVLDWINTITGACHEQFT